MVRHKYNPQFGVDDQIELLPNSNKIPIKLPNVKMHLQPDRPPNLARAHDARFENINRDPKILSKVKSPPTIDFGKIPERDTSNTLINKNTVCHMYSINDSQVKKRSNITFVDIGKMKDRPKDGEIDYTHDELRASQQQLGSTSGKSLSLGGINGPISMNKQAPRSFAHFKVAEQQEK